MARVSRSLGRSVGTSLGVESHTAKRAYWGGVVRVGSRLGVRSCVARELVREQLGSTAGRRGVVWPSELAKEGSHLAQGSSPERGVAWDRGKSIGGARSCPKGEESGWWEVAPTGK